MPLPTLFDICRPRQDVLDGAITMSDFAADLAQVLRGDAPEDYQDPAKFFANTHPTRGLKDLLWNVCLRLSGSKDQVASIFRLDTNYGGGKTHALIALAHAARGLHGVAQVDEFIAPDLLPRGHVRLAAFDGENADPFNGRPLGDGLRAYTPWGELAYALAGQQGYALVQRSDVEGGAPGADTLKELFGGEPTLILLDELSVYLRKLRARDRERAGGQLTAFLTALFKAVESSPNAAVVYTLAIGKDGLATDAYSEENQFIADKMEEAESVSARKAALLDPTEEDETVQVLRRRLFAHIDDTQAATVIAAYRQLWEMHKDHLPTASATENRVEAFIQGFPFHPELIDTLKAKTSTLSNFQRVRGMLRFLARTVAQLWQQRPKDTYAIHLHHLDPGFEPIRQEIVTRLGQRQFVPAIRSDVASGAGDQPALAQTLDAQHYVGLAPYGSYIARVILLHTLAFNDTLKGLSPEQLRYTVLSPGTDISFIDDATRRFVQTSAYLDDRPHMPLRFLAEANLTQILRRQEQQVDLPEVRVQLHDRIKAIFNGTVLTMIAFPGGPYDMPDEVDDGKPILAVLSYDAAEVAADHVVIPELVERIYRSKGSGGDLRLNRNNLVFLVADAGRKEEMRRHMVRRLALSDLRKPERLNELAEHQRDLILEWFRRSEMEVALAIQQCYRHVLYPSRNRVEGADVDLAHTAIDVQSASERPGDGQRPVVQILCDNNKLRLPEHAPDSPTYIRDRTPLRRGVITTAALRIEFRRDPALPMLVGDDVFLKGIRQGIEQGEYVYQHGDLLWGQGDPWATIKIDEQSFLYTAAYAREQEIWPRPQSTPEPSGAREAPAGWPSPSGIRSNQSVQAQPALPETALTTEGVLREALTTLWERARAQRVQTISMLHLKLYDAVDAFRLLGLISGIPKADKSVHITGGYETAEGGTLEITFTGPVADAQPVKDFLDPQLRAAREKDVSVTLTLTFSEGLPLAGDAPEKLTERLSRFGTGAAYVSATTEGGA
jgi:hypothetical protein